MNTVEIVANELSRKDRDLPPLEMTTPVGPAMCATDIAVGAWVVNLARGRVAEEAARRLGIQRIATHDVGFMSRHGAPGSAGAREMSADELIGLLA